MDARIDFAENVHCYYDVCGQRMRVPNLVLPKENLDRVREFTWRSDDVLVAAYPKSGTHWIGEIVYLLQTGADLPAARRHLFMHRVPMAELRQPGVACGLDLVAARPSPRAACTHLPAPLHPAVLSGPPAARPRVIVISRNPKDVLVSYFFFLRDVVRSPSAQTCTISWDTFFQDFREGRYDFLGPLDWLLSWWPHRDESNLLFLSYEQLMRDHERGVRQIARFIGCGHVGNDVIQRVVSATTFAAMRENDSVNWERDHPHKRPGGGHFLRSGQVGDWRNHLTAHQDAFVNELIDKKWTASGVTTICSLEDT